jgi:hypothetical protein
VSPACPRPLIPGRSQLGFAGPAGYELIRVSPLLFEATCSATSTPRLDGPAAGRARHAAAVSVSAATPETPAPSAASPTLKPSSAVTWMVLRRRLLGLRLLGLPLRGDLPTSLDFVGDTAFVTTLNGEVWKITHVSKH